MDKWTEGQLQGNQRGLPPLQPGEVRCACYAPTRRYKGNVPICSDCQQNQAADDYQAAMRRLGR